jgi:arylsulfatase A-like enzyme
MIIFSSDNGFNCGHHGIWGKGNSTYPHNLYDTSVKVPAIFCHPGRIAEDAVSNSLMSGYDIFPTILDCVGIEYVREEKMPGRSFLPVLLGETQPFEEPVIVYDELGAARMIRTKEWKYIHRYPLGPNELYHLTDDPGENHNLLVGGSPGLNEWEEQTAEMKRTMERWFDQYADRELDGRLQGVTGRGQIRFVGSRADGKPSFSPLEKIKKILSYEK